MLFTYLLSNLKVTVRNNVYINLYILVLTRKFRSNSNYLWATLRFKFSNTYKMTKKKKQIKTKNFKYLLDTL